MKILIYGLNYHPELTGIGKYNGELACWLSKRGHDVRVICAPPYYPEWAVGDGYSQYKYQQESCDGVEIMRCPLWVPRHPTGLKRLLHLFSFSLSSVPVIFKQIFWGPDIVLSVEPTFFCAPATILFSKITGSKSILHIQDFEIDAAFNLGIIKGMWLKQFVLFCEKKIIERFDRVSTISFNMLKRLCSKGVDETNSFYLPNWVDTSFIKPVLGGNYFRSALGISDDECVALYSGNFGEKQGVEILLDAAKTLSTRGNLKFIFCGAGANYERLKNAAKDIENVFWLPLQKYEKLNELLNAADIHLLPQRSDAADLVMPSKLSGMMASGRPVIATVDEDTEIANVVQGRGIIVAPGDINAFCSAIVDLSNNVELRKSLGDKARFFAVSEWGSENVMLRFEKELLEIK